MMLPHASPGRNRRRIFLASLAAASMAGAAGASGEDPLHIRIDQMLESAYAGAPAPPAGDAEFLRRASLALAGVIPSAGETREFLADPAPEKRALLVERLLAAPGHVQRLADVFDVMLMERRAEKHVKAAEWRAFLTEAFARRTPLDALARAVLSADGTEEASRGAARFLLDREADPHLLTRDVGRVFLGVDLQCAQCHDHPRIDDYLQRDYYGLYAFVSRTYLFQPDPAKPAVLAEKGEGDVSFQSVFTSHRGVTDPRLPGGPEVAEPEVPVGREYAVAPDPAQKELRPVPSHSRRGLLAENVLQAPGRVFARNMANRLWALAMGRGIVEPADLHHAGNPPAHPELLELLGESLAASGYDATAFLRELALTRAFQRSGLLPGSLAAAAAEASARLEQLEAVRERWASEAEEARTQVEEARARLEAAEAAQMPKFDEWVKARDAWREAVKQEETAEAARASAQTACTARGEVEVLLREAAGGTAAVAQEAPGIAELAEAAAALRARAEQAVQETEAARKDLAEKGAVLEAKEQERAAAQSGASAVRPGWEEAEQAVTAAREEFVTAEGRRREAEVRLQLAERREAGLRALESWQAAEGAMRSAGQEREAVRERREDWQGSLAAVEASLGILRSLGVEKRALAESLPAALQSRREELGLREGERTAVSKASDGLAALRQRLPEDAAVKQAAERIAAAAKRLEEEAARLAEEIGILDARAVEATRAAEASDGAAAAMEQRRAALAAGAEGLEQNGEAAEARLAEARSQRAKAEAAIAEQWEDLFALGPLVPLTPEQLCFAMMAGTGFLAQQTAAAEQEYEQAHARPAGESELAAWEADRRRAVSQMVRDRSQGPVNEFVRLFGGAAGQPQGDFYATVDQALFFSNAGLVRGWLSPSGSNLTARLLEREDPQALAEELYLSVLTRLPDPQETEQVRDYLQRRAAERSAAVQELAWSLLTSVEFRFNH